MKSHEHEPHSPPQETPLDAWHQHPASEGYPQKEHGAHANTHLLIAIFAVITVSTVAFSVLIGLFVISQVNSLKAERESAPLPSIVADAATYKEAAQANQTSYGWTAQGNIRMPIDRAMEKVVAQYQEDAGQ